MPKLRSLTPHTYDGVFQDTFYEAPEEWAAWASSMGYVERVAEEVKPEPAPVLTREVKAEEPGEPGDKRGYKRRDLKAQS